MAGFTDVPTSGRSGTPRFAAPRGDRSREREQQRRQAAVLAAAAVRSAARSGLWPAGFTLPTASGERG